MNIFLKLDSDKSKTKKSLIILMLAFLIFTASCSSKKNLKQPYFSYNKHPREQVIAKLGPEHGFVLQSPAGNQRDLTQGYKKGNGSLSLTAETNDSIVFSRKSSIKPTIDLTKKYLKIWIKVSDVSRLSQLLLYLSSDNFKSSFYTFKLSNNINRLSSNKWIPVTLGFSQAVITGKPRRDAINSIQIRIKNNKKGLLTVYWSDLSAINEPAEGAVSITFDDGRESQFNAASIMAKYGFSGTAYIIPDLVGSKGYMTLEQLKILQYDFDWDISGHYQEPLTKLSKDKLEGALRSVKSYLLKNGFKRGSDHFAYPKGSYNEDTVLPLVKKYFKSGRTINEYNESLPPADNYRLRVLLVTSITKPDDIKKAVIDAKREKEWLILVFHKIVKAAKASTEYRQESFKQAMDDIAETKIRVVSVGKVINWQHE